MYASDGLGTDQVDTVDENENETAGRGMISNREIKEGDELFALPINLLLTKDAAQKVKWMDVLNQVYVRDNILSTPLVAVLGNENWPEQTG